MLISLAHVCGSMPITFIPGAMRMYKFRQCQKTGAVTVGKGSGISRRGQSTPKTGASISGPAAAASGFTPPADVRARKRGGGATDATYGKVCRSYVHVLNIPRLSPSRGVGQSAAKAARFDAAALSSCHNAVATTNGGRESRKLTRSHLTSH